MFVKKGDKVRVIAGKDKGVEAVVVTALPKANKVVVEGVNIIKKHQKPNNENPQGAIVEKEAPLHVSNVQVLDKNGVDDITFTSTSLNKGRSTTTSL